MSFSNCRVCGVPIPKGKDFCPPCHPPSNHSPEEKIVLYTGGFLMLVWLLFAIFDFVFFDFAMIDWLFGTEEPFE
jgi:hypothetical protein